MFNVDGMDLSVQYLPAESNSGLFGGNSNWRGPIWFPVNYLLIESLQKFHHYYGDDFKIECPTGSGRFMSIDEVAREIAARLTRIFLKDPHGRRPGILAVSAHCRTTSTSATTCLFYEYFHGDTGRGVGRLAPDRLDRPGGEAAAAAQALASLTGQQIKESFHG